MKKLCLVICLLLVFGGSVFAGLDIPKGPVTNPYSGSFAFEDDVTIGGTLVVEGGTTSTYTGFYGDTLTNTGAGVWCFAGVAGDPTDACFDLDGTYPKVYSSVDDDYGLNDPLILQDVSRVYSESVPVGATATDVIDITIPADQTAGGRIDYVMAVTAADAGFTVTGIQIQTGTLVYSAYNFGGTMASNLDEPTTPTQNVTGGVLNPVFALVNGTGKVTLTALHGTNLAPAHLFPVFGFTVLQNGVQATITPSP